MSAPVMPDGAPAPPTAQEIAQALASLYTTTVDEGMTLPQPVEDEARRVIDACVVAGLLREDEAA